MLDSIPPDEKAVLFTALGALSLVSFVGSLVLIPFLVARMPVDYFHRPKRPRLPFAKRHPIIRWSLLVAKNLLGGVLLIGGVLMLVLPGQGLLTILMGLVLIDYPGKRSLERFLITRPSILRAVNWLRRKADQPPLKP